VYPVKDFLLFFLMIEHIAISGAGPAGIIQVGMVQQALTDGIFALKNIKSFHGTSAGSILSLLLLIGVPIEEMVDYVVLRPLEKWLKFDVTNFYENKGMVSSECLSEFIAPFFHAYNTPLEFTLQELYERTGVEFYVYTTNVVTLESVQLHHSTHPDLPAIQAIMMSANMPILFTPVKYQGVYYIDGGVCMHCPRIPFPEENVLTFDISNRPAVKNLDDTRTYFGYLLSMTYHTISNNKYPPKGNLIEYNEYTVSDMEDWKRYIYEEDYRRQMIEVGKKATLRYLEKKIV
jgi:predicted acylesterase/phospholipase RssA